MKTKSPKVCEACGNPITAINAGRRRYCVPCGVYIQKNNMARYLTKHKPVPATEGKDANGQV